MIFIHSILFFILGVVVTAFLLTLFAPILWRRALYLARKAVKTEVPLSLNEVEADRDFLRAAHAVELCRVEEQCEAADLAKMQARLALGRVQERVFYLAQFESLSEDLQEKLSSSLRENAGLKGNISDLNRTIRGLNVIKKKSENQEQLLKERRQQINDLLRQIADLNNLLESMDVRNTKLENDRNIIQEELERSESARREAEAGLENVVALTDNNLRNDREIFANLHQEIKDIAANIVASVAGAEGSDSPILQLIEKPENPTSLAAAIRNAMIKAAETEEQTLVSESNNEPLLAVSGNGCTAKY